MEPAVSLLRVESWTFSARLVGAPEPRLPIAKQGDVAPRRFASSNHVPARRDRAIGLVAASAPRVTVAGKSSSACLPRMSRPGGEALGDRAEMPVRLRQIEDAEPLAIDYSPIGALIPFARKARTHSEAQVALIAGSIREYDFTNPVLVDGESGIIAGHGRVLAARKLGPG